MKERNRTMWSFILFATFLLAAAPSLRAQGSGQGQQPPKQPPPEQQPPAPKQQPTQPGQTAPKSDQPANPQPPVNKEEEDAYKAFFDAKPTDLQAYVAQGEAFLGKYPQSRYAAGVYSRLTSAYMNLGQVDKMFAAGEKALSVNPDDVTVMSLMAMVLPRRVNPGALDADQKLQKSEAYSKKVIALVASMEKPTGLTDEQFTKAKNEVLSLAHSGLGVTYFQRQKYTEATPELEQATQLATNPDPVDFYVLGVSYQEVKRYNDAASAYGHCGAISGQLQAPCKTKMEEAKKQALLQPAAPKQ